MGIYGILTGFCIPLNVAALHGIGVSKEEVRAKVAGEFLTLSLYISIAILLALLCLSPALKQWWHLESFLPFLGIGILVTTTAVLTTIYGVFQGLQKYETLLIYRVLQALLTSVIGTGLVMLGMKALGAILGFACGMAILIIYFVHGWDWVKSRWNEGSGKRPSTCSKKRLLIERSHFMSLWLAGITCGGSVIVIWAGTRRPSRPMRRPLF